MLESILIILGLVVLCALVVYWRIKHPHKHGG